MNTIDEQKMTDYARWESSKPYAHELVLKPKRNVSYRRLPLVTGVIWAGAIEVAFILFAFTVAHFWR